MKRQLDNPDYLMGRTIKILTNLHISSKKRDIDITFNKMIDSDVVNNF